MVVEILSPGVILVYDVGRIEERRAFVAYCLIVGLQANFVWPPNLVWLTQ